jgi:hypothetical protein
MDDAALGGFGPIMKDLAGTCVGDIGATWKWVAVTNGSSVDDLRPIVPNRDADPTALLWMRGTYATAQTMTMNVVGTISGLWRASPKSSASSDGWGLSRPVCCVVAAWREVPSSLAPPERPPRAECPI